MATSAGSTLPLTPVGGEGGTLSGTLWHGKANGALTQGDVLIVTASELANGNADPAVDVVIGVAAQDAVANDRMTYYPILPGTRWEANVTAVGPVDVVGVRDTDIFSFYNIVEDGTDGNAVLEPAGGGVDLAFSLEYARQHNIITQDADPETGGVGVTNPRVVFCFINGLLFPNTVA